MHLSQFLSTSFSPDFGVTEASILDMCEGVLGQGTALKVRIATDRETGEHQQCDFR